MRHVTADDARTASISTANIVDDDDDDLFPSPKTAPSTS
jgi:hypothetical protein